ncbi:MAG: branched-chain amino acid ABC transporter permease [Acidithiobacillales bacterium]
MSAVLLQAVVSGIALGLIYAGVGAGFSLVFSTGRLINLSHGEFVLMGGYILYVLCRGIGWPWPAGLAASAVVGAVLGVALPPLVRRLPDREIDGLAATLGVAFILQNLLLLWATATYRVIPGGYWLQAVGVGPVVLSRVTLVAAGAAAAAMAGLDLWLRLSWTGSGLRAVAQSPPAASSLGVSPARMEWVAFAVGGAVAGSAGGLVLLIRFLTPGEGPAWTLVALAVAFLGGRTRAVSLAGAGIALGILESLATALGGGGWREVVASGAVLLWLLTRERTLAADA